ncbi:hypothetical protein QFZ68_002109 [Streptomyces sp. V1I6]|nr:hypothetical protein [Streptomyces sp. V1I6]
MPSSLAAGGLPPNELMVQWQCKSSATAVQVPTDKAVRCG